MQPATGERRHVKPWLILATGLVAVLALVLFTACKNDKKSGDSQPTTAPTQPSGVDYSSLSGDIRIDGSSTVGPLTEAVAEEFRSEASNVHVNVAISGTGGGFERFCNGETLISDASRTIKQAETDACAGNNITDIVEFQVAIDALTVMVNPDNTWVTCLTTDQLFKLFSDTSVKKWSDVDASWPAEDIHFYYPGSDSGTFDYFNSTIITGKDKNATHRGDGTASEDDNVLAIGIENDKDAIGYFGFSYYQEAGQQLKAVAIDGGSGCLEPTAQTALDGTYTPLSRPLFIYTRERFLRDKPEVLGFVEYYLDNLETLVPDVGFVAMAPDLAAQQQAKLAPYLP